MQSYLTILIFISTIFSIDPNVVKNTSVCLTDDLYGKITADESQILRNRRELVRGRLPNNLFRNQPNSILTVPVVFHNIYKIVNGTAMGSYCDFG